MEIWALGLMTGTVLDGEIDIALLRTDGVRVGRFGPARLARYPRDLRPLLRDTFEAAKRWNFEGDEPAIFAEAERALTLGQSEAVRRFLDEEGIDPATIGAVGFHGQTVLHRRREAGRPGATRQLGDGALMARELGIPVVYDFRSSDVAAGGQGAPLAPVYHAALLRHAGAGSDTAILNLGGVANITWEQADGTLHAFDTGPANAPLNDWVRAQTGEEMDRDGQLAARGVVDAARLARLLEHPYLAEPYPKSLDRDDFTSRMADGLSLEDGAATLTAFTAASIARGLALLPGPVHSLALSGGGRHNPVLRRMIAERCGIEAVDADALGLRGDTVEAECFAFLAVRTLRDMPLSFPGTTGVPGPTTGGRIARP